MNHEDPHSTVPGLKHTFEQILDLARRAPSGVNAQPWQLLVLTQDAAGRLVDLVQANRDHVLAAAVDRFPAARSEDLAAQITALQAPLAAFCLIDDRLGQGSELDDGLFLQSIRLLAQPRGWDLRVLPVWRAAHDLVSTVVPLLEHQRVLCGLALVPCSSGNEAQANVQVIWVE